MKTLKTHNLVIAFSLLFASCASVKYLGDNYPATSVVDVYYDAKDVKKDYKVIGHLSLSLDNTQESNIKNNFILKARAIGADGIIILQNIGHDDHEEAKADAIKYNK